MTMKILVTGFEPFNGESINPSLEVIRDLDGGGIEGDLSTLLLPVDRHRAVDQTIECVTRLHPDLIIMLGEAGGRFRVNPERVAINVDDYRIPDNAGNQPADEQIVEGGPAGYFSTLPVRAITNRLIDSGIPAAISNSAGTYLCNRLFYSVMHLINTRDIKARAGFIHLPYLHEQTLPKQHDFPSLSRETLLRAARIAIEVSTNAGGVRV